MLKFPIVPPFYVLPRDLIQLDRRPARDRFCKGVQAKEQPAGQEEKLDPAGVVSDQLRAVCSVFVQVQQ
jgi:hypothetical protein